jgi:RNA polymerase sigma-70 factor (ECF subfamily)
MDPAQAAQWLMRHRTALYAYVFAGVRNHADAEDVLQNVSLAVVESCGTLRDADGFLAWALEIARRRMLEHYRRTQRDQVLDPELLAQLADAAVRIESRLPSSRYQAALQTCLEGLPPTSRELMRMRYDGASGGIAELAERFQRSVQSIYAQIKRIKSALRECVERRLATETNG